ncbi:MAG: arsenate reductase (glutaredoxin) [Myxococcales bacterium]|nr:arsenate reductase (glutaredoxin) [Myxococcales bacterium]
MLEDHGVTFTYREYRKEPLDREELRQLLAKLGVGPRQVLRSRDAKQLGLSGDESDERLLELMAEHPTLLQRPIGVVGPRAVVGRPPEALLRLLE